MKKFRISIMASLFQILSEGKKWHTSGITLSGGKNVKSAYFVPPVTPYKLFICIANNLYHLHYFCTHLKGDLPYRFYMHILIHK